MKIYLRMKKKVAINLYLVDYNETYYDIDLPKINYSEGFKDFWIEENYSIENLIDCMTFKKNYNWMFNI